MQGIGFDLLNLQSIAPMAILAIFALFILCVGAFSEATKKFYAVLTILALILDFGVLVGYNGGLRGFFNLMLIDGVALTSMLIVVFSAIFFILLSLGAEASHEYSMSEFFAIFLFMICAYEFMVSSDNLIMIFIGLETSSLTLYTLIALHNRKKSIEAALKYFITGALGAGFFAFGAAILFLVSGNLEISKIAEVAQSSNLQTSITLFAGCAFMIVAIGFKLSLVPFHTWAPDVYEGASSAMAGFISVVPKIAAFIVGMRLFEGLSHIGAEWINTVLYVVAVLTMTLGNVMALVQIDVKRMLAFSSISHAGFGLSAVVIGTTQANSALLTYWILYAFANLGAFSMLWIARTKQNSWHPRFDHPYEKFNGLIKILPLPAIVMAIFMFSLAGIPPFSVFWGKLYLLSSAVNAGYYFLAIIMAVNSAIALYYYLKLVVCMFLREPIVQDPKIYLQNVSNPLRLAVAVAAVCCIAAPFVVKFITPLLNNSVFLSGF